MLHRDSMNYTIIMVVFTLFFLLHVGSVLCASSPFMKINFEEVPENEDYYTLTNPQYSLVRCVLMGSEADVQQVVLTCGDDDLGKTAIGNTTSEILFFFDKEMHNKTCTCESTLKDGEVEQFQVRFKYQCSPRFADWHLSYREFTTVRGEYLSVSFDIIASPCPMNYTLTKDDEPISEDEYGVYNTTGKEAFTCTVTLTMDNMTFADSGQYKLTIINGIDYDMEGQFKLSVVSVPVANATTVIENDEDDYWNPLYMLSIDLPIVILVVLFIMMILVKDHHSDSGHIDAAYSLSYITVATQRPSKYMSRDEGSSVRHSYSSTNDRTSDGHLPGTQSHSDNDDTSTSSL